MYSINIQLLAVRKTILYYKIYTDYTMTDIKPIFFKEFFYGKKETNEISKKQVILKYLRVDILWEFLNI